MRKFFGWFFTIFILISLLVPIFSKNGLAATVPTSTWREKMVSGGCRLKHNYYDNPLPGDDDIKLYLCKGTVLYGTTTNPATTTATGTVSFIFNEGNGRCEKTENVKVWTPNWAAYCTIDSVTTLTDWIFWIVFVVAAIIIVIAGLMYMTSAGDPEKTSKAKGVLIMGVVGIIVAVLAKFIPALVRYFIGV